MKSSIVRTDLLVLLLFKPDAECAQPSRISIANANIVEVLKSLGANLIQTHDT